jgi:hypothetical protein
VRNSTLSIHETVRRGSMAGGLERSAERFIGAG